MATYQASMPLSNVPVLGPDGRMSEVWWRFLLALWNRTGGGSGQPTDQLTIADVLSLEEVPVVPTIPDLYRQIANTSLGLERVAAQSVFAPAFAEEVTTAPVDATPSSPCEMTFCPLGASSSAQATHSVVVGASPFTYLATSHQAVRVGAGTISAISYARSGASLGLGVVSAGQIIEMSPGDTLTITYSVAPTITAIPR